jgi:hypothetical protein
MYKRPKTRSYILVYCTGLSWDAMLKYTKIELELLSDYEMLLLIKQGIRGGIS